MTRKFLLLYAARGRLRSQRPTGLLRAGTGSKKGINYTNSPNCPCREYIDWRISSIEDKKSKGLRIFFPVAMAHLTSTNSIRLCIDETSRTSPRTRI